MKLNIETEENIVKGVQADLTPTEFMLLRHILNLACIHTELNEIDGRLASKMYRDIEEYLKEHQK